MKTKIVMVVIVALLLLVACGPAKEAEEPIKPTEPVAVAKKEPKPVPISEPPAKPVVEPTAETIDDSVSEIGSSVDEVTDMDDEFNVDELDQLDSDLAELETLDLG